MKNGKSVPKKNVKKQNKVSAYMSWPIKVFFLAVALSLFFSVSSEFILSGAGLVLSAILILLLIFVAVITDMIGVAVTACPTEPFLAMASRKVKGAKEALVLLKHADRVSSLCADVIGDICGIISGAAGASIVIKIAIESSSNTYQILIASLISSLIAGLTIFGKAMGKKLSMDKSSDIVLFIGKILSVFTKKDKKEKKDKNPKK